MKTTVLLALFGFLPAVFSHAAAPDYSPFAGKYAGSFKISYYPDPEDEDQSISQYPGTSVQVFRTANKGRLASLDAANTVYESTHRIRYKLNASRMVSTNEYASYESEYGMIGFSFSGKAAVSRRAIKVNLWDRDFRTALSLVLKSSRNRVTLTTIHTSYGLDGRPNVTETYVGSRAKRKNERRVPRP